MAAVGPAHLRHSVAAVPSHRHLCQGLLCPSLLSPCARACVQCGDPERKWPPHLSPQPGQVGEQQACHSLGSVVSSRTGTGVWDQRTPRAEGLAFALPTVP